MRSQLILRRTRLLTKSPSLPHRALLSSTRVPRYPRVIKDSPRSAVRLSKRESSSATTSVPDASPELPDEDPSEGANNSSDPPETVDAEKPVKRRMKATSEAATYSRAFPDDLIINILWDPEMNPFVPPGGKLPSTVPPPEILEDIMTNLHITLHPHTQHKAAYASATSGPVEPTMALYCPIEGGDYVIDDTVREMGRQTGADVLVIDAVHLAAGECGDFGKAASVFQFPTNPLHFASPVASSSRNTNDATSTADEDEEGFEDVQRMMGGRVTFQLLAPMPISSRSGRTLVATPRRANSSMSKMKAFFDELINVQMPGGGSTDARSPRIIYIRDFPTLAASSPSWYPALLAAVRSRRQGASPRQSSPVQSQTTIVFGVTPPIIPTPSTGPSGSPASQIFNVLLPRQTGTAVGTTSIPPKNEHGESDVAQKMRERRLRDRLRRWERGDPSLYEELPRLLVSNEGEDGSDDGPNIVVMGGPQDAMGLPAMLAGALGNRMPGRSSSDEEKPAKFFRTSVVVPRIRNRSEESCRRIERRQEINELTMRMGVAAIGGWLGKTTPTVNEVLRGEGDPTCSDPSEAHLSMYKEWGRILLPWSDVKKIADSAVGKTLAENFGSKNASSAKSLTEPTVVTWKTIADSWNAHKTSRDIRKAWIQQSSVKPSSDKSAEENSRRAAEAQADEVIERVKRDPELDHHEQRLLGCIVDTATISTTFNHVHLPARTIDSVRTIVSLPLLHPEAFQHGILKEHAMTGCLLFGPPGTGKTLVVRALAKEAGCRMMVVSPSDVMDMYVGEGEKLVRSVFSLARRLSPCVVFIDEIDALFGARMGARESGGAIAHRGVITEFMQEMDGLKSNKDDNIILIGATNRPFDLDDAVLRRLPRRLLVDLPGEKEREGILNILLRDEPLASDVDLKVLAQKTESFSGSDLKHLCVSAALDAVKERVSVPWKPMVHSALSEESNSASQLSVGTSVNEKVVHEPPSLSETLDIDISTSPTLASSASVDTEPGPVSADTEDTAESVAAVPQHPPRTLHWRNFAAALKEITPSSSEALGSLADLRKWNEEFGEGRKEKRKQIWGKGRFGFTDRPVSIVEEGKVAEVAAASRQSSDIIHESNSS